MKRILTFVALMGVMFVAMAQRPMATLSHQGKLTFFNSGSSFGEAVNAAVDGDTIYLSEGKYSCQGLVDNNTITKKVTVIGNGRKSHIVDDITVKIKGTLTSALFDGVKLEKVTLNDSITNPEFKKCKIATLHAASYSDDWIKDLKVDRCNIDLFDGYYHYIESYELYNSKIGRLDTYCKNYMSGRIINCHVKEISNWYGFMTSSIVIGQSGDNSNRFYENCLLDWDKSNHTSTKYENCYDKPGTVNSLLDDNMDVVEGLDLQASGFLGADGTVVGVYGGQWFPYSETPSMPTVDSSKSTVDFDQDTNTLKVKITVTPN